MTVKNARKLIKEHKIGSDEYWWGYLAALLELQKKRGRGGAIEHGIP